MSAAWMAVVLAVTGLVEPSRKLTEGGAVMTAEMRIHASFNPGAVVRVLGGVDDGNLRELWAGISPAESVQTIAISPPAEMTRIKLELDTAKVPGWNEIDAVALIDAAGTPIWAATAISSSVWSKPAK